MLNPLIITLGKLASIVLKNLNLGHGSTWPGHLALSVNKRFIRETTRESGLKVILVAGTNGKTTTSLLIRTILEQNGKKVIHNDSGANLLNGIASTLILNSKVTGKIDADFAIFEVDENALPLILSEFTPAYLLLLNIFRDQLDRYGEIDIIARKWEDAITKLSDKTTLIVNADDPRTASLGLNRKSTIYFGLPDDRYKKLSDEHAVDSTYCPKCGTKLTYASFTYSHLGKWSCRHCGLMKPEVKESAYLASNLSGIYNEYNVSAAVTISRVFSTDEGSIANSLRNFVPAFGRQEKIVTDGKTVQLFLSKNPTGFNESLKTIIEQGAKHVMFILNDGIADGRDVSWIWDIAMEEYSPSLTHITVSGDRCYDMGLRLKYTNKQIANSQWQIEENLREAIDYAIKQTPKNETLYILPTYTAMLEVRKILKGKKIL